MCFCVVFTIIYDIGKAIEKAILQCPNITKSMAMPRATSICSTLSFIMISFFRNNICYINLYQ